MTAGGGGSRGDSAVCRVPAREYRSACIAAAGYLSRALLDFGRSTPSNHVRVERVGNVFAAEEKITHANSAANGSRARIHGHEPLAHLSHSAR
jgi:nucleoid-associated protein YgaU